MHFTFASAVWFVKFFQPHFGLAVAEVVVVVLVVVAECFELIVVVASRVGQLASIRPRDANYKCLNILNL